MQENVPPSIANSPPLTMSLYSRRRCGEVARSLAVGFGGAVAMWALAYFAMMKPGELVGEFLFVATMICAVGAGYLAGAHRMPNERGAIAGGKTGLVIATINMLVIGSLIGENLSGGKDGDARGNVIAALMWFVGNYALTLILTMVGGAIAAARDGGKENQRPWRDWFSLFTRVAAATVFLLLITGGLVTTRRAGLAVPDWPNSFGHNMLLYPMSHMKGGIFYEHAHRLYGTLVGMTALTLAICTWWFDQRRWLRWLALGCLLMVCIQGYLGGARVYLTSLPLAIVHGVFGQVVFATVCTIAAMNSRSWGRHRAPSDLPAAQTDRRWTMILVLALLLQLALGAMYRHLKDTSPGALHVLYTHILWAMFVAGLAIFAGGRAWRGNPAAQPADQRLLMRSGKSVIHSVGLQIALGVVAMIAVLSAPEQPADAVEPVAPALWAAIFTTAHQAVGALLLAMATMLMLWTRRILPPVALPAH